VSGPATFNLEPQVQSSETRADASLTDSPILVIDDDPATLQLVRSVLEANGHRCLTAASAEEALAIVDSTPGIPIAISDINLPGMDGILFLERINSYRQSHTPPRVIFLTAFPRLDFAVAALRLGAIDFLTKPVRPKELLRAVATAVERVQNERSALHSPEDASALVQQAQALASALRGWAHAQPQAQGQPPGPAAPRAALADPGEFALLGMEQFRRLRREFPPLSELDDVAWDLLLELMRAEKSSNRLSVSSLSISIEHVSSTTALRRIQELVKAEHMVRVPDPTDARRDFVALAAKTRDLLQSYLERVGNEFAAAAASR
jgi:CheY-like chemotaxis protein/DNA-binding MarR family transcriptional regulator